MDARYYALLTVRAMNKDSPIRCSLALVTPIIPASNIVIVVKTGCPGRLIVYMGLYGSSYIRYVALEGGQFRSCFVIEKNVFLSVSLDVWLQYR